MRGQDEKEEEQYHSGTCPGDKKDASQGDGRAVAMRGHQYQRNKLATLTCRVATEWTEITLKVKTIQMIV